MIIFERKACHSGLSVQGASTENWRSVVRIPAMTQIFLSKIMDSCCLHAGAEHPLTSSSDATNWNHCVILISTSLSFWKRWRWLDRNFLICKKRWTTIVNADSMCFPLCSGVLLWHPSGAQFSSTTGDPWQFCCTRSGKLSGNDW